jgi:sRNA-binding regulator protein Hfq
MVRRVHNGVVTTRRRRRGDGDDKKAAPSPDMKKKAEELVAAGMPFQMAMAVVQGRLELNEALERMARKQRVESLMRRHDLSRALATQIVMGHANLETVLAKRRLNSHRDENLLRSCLDRAVQEQVRLGLALHGGRNDEGLVSAIDAYTFTFTGRGGEEESIHKLQVKYAFDAENRKKVRRVVKVDKDVAAKAKEPIVRPQDRYSCSDKRLFSVMDANEEVVITLLEGDVLRGHVTWFGRYEFGLQVKGGVNITVFRHALRRLHVLS